MRLNPVERMMLNNPARRMVQRFYEARLLLRMAGRLEGKRALEIGCGQGFGMEIILGKFGAAKVCGIDLDPKMVARAKRRVSPHGSHAEVTVGDVSAIQAPNQSFDAVFDFGVIHHVPVWEDAVREVGRVLKPGGIFVFEEVSKQALERWVYRALFEHPKENRFTAEDFVAALERNGMPLGGEVVHFVFGDFFAGVGRRTG